jgi:hypothetical protein
LLLLLLTLLALALLCCKQAWVCSCTWTICCHTIHGSCTGSTSSSSSLACLFDGPT